MIKIRKVVLIALFCVLSFLCLTLGLGGIIQTPQSVFAGKSTAAKIGANEFGSLEQAIQDANEGDTILIIDDCNCDRIETGNKSLVLKASGKNVKITLRGSILFGVNQGNKTFTLSGGDNGESLTIVPQQSGYFNAFRPIAIRQGNKLILKDGVILKDSNVQDGFGGAMINVANGATLDMQGGLITNSWVISTDYDKYYNKLGRGGAIYIENGGTFKMSDGEIKGCVAQVAGGAIYSCGNVEITGGKITECKVRGLSDGEAVKAKGGAIYLMSGSFTMTGGEISGNTLQDVEDMRGAGVYVGTSVNATLGGKAIINNNKDKDGQGKNSNLFLYDNVKFNLGLDNNQPEDGMNISISTKSEPTAGNKIQISNNATRKDFIYLFADNREYCIRTNGSVTDDFFNVAKYEKKATVNKPVANKINYSYTGSDISYDIPLSDLYTVSNNVQTEIGTHVVIVSLSNVYNYTWDDEGIDDLEYQFIINQSKSKNLILGICIGSLLLILIIIYLFGYFFLYRKGKLDEKKIKIIYSFLPKNNDNN